MPAGDDISGCPAGLDATAKSHWIKIRNLMVKAGRWQPEDSLLLARFLKSAEVARLAWLEVDQEGLTAEGYKGQPVQSPALKTAREAERDANDYARELGITPAARAKGGESPKAPSLPNGFGDFLTSNRN